jgi:hypothetical protein
MAAMIKTKPAKAKTISELAAIYYPGRAVRVDRSCGGWDYDGYATGAAWCDERPIPKPEKYECRTCGGPIHLQEEKCSYCTTATGFVVLR